MDRQPMTRNAALNILAAGTAVPWLMDEAVAVEQRTRPVEAITPMSQDGRLKGKLPDSVDEIEARSERQRESLASRHRASARYLPSIPSWQRKAATQALIRLRAADDPAAAARKMLAGAKAGVLAKRVAAEVALHGLPECGVTLVNRLWEGMK